MATHYETPRALEIETRIKTPIPASAPRRGKMNVAQMMARCSAALEVAVGDRVVTQAFIGRLGWSVGS